MPNSEENKKQTAPQAINDNDNSNHGSENNSAAPVKLDLGELVNSAGLSGEELFETIRDNAETMGVLLGYDTVLNKLDSYHKLALAEQHPQVKKLLLNNPSFTKWLTNFIKENRYALNINTIKKYEHDISTECDTNKNINESDSAFISSIKSILGTLTNNITQQAEPNKSLCESIIKINKDIPKDLFHTKIQQPFYIDSEKFITGLSDDYIFSLFEQKEQQDFLMHLLETNLFYTITVAKTDHISRLSDEQLIILSTKHQEQFNQLLKNKISENRFQTIINLSILQRYIDTGKPANTKTKFSRLINLIILHPDLYRLAKHSEELSLAILSFLKINKVKIDSALLLQLLSEKLSLLDEIAKKEYIDLFKQLNHFDQVTLAKQDSALFALRFMELQSANSTADHKEIVEELYNIHADAFSTLFQKPNKEFPRNNIKHIVVGFNSYLQSVSNPSETSNLDNCQLKNVAATVTEEIFSPANNYEENNDQEQITESSCNENVNQANNNNQHRVANTVAAENNADEHNTPVLLSLASFDQTKLLAEVMSNEAQAILILQHFRILKKPLDSGQLLEIIKQYPKLASLVFTDSAYNQQLSGKFLSTLIEVIDSPLIAIEIRKNQELLKRLHAYKQLTAACRQHTVNFARSKQDNIYNEENSLDDRFFLKKAYADLASNYEAAIQWLQATTLNPEQTQEACEKFFLQFYNLNKHLQMKCAPSIINLFVRGKAVSEANLIYLIKLLPREGKPYQSLEQIFKLIHEGKFNHDLLIKSLETLTGLEKDAFAIIISDFYQLHKTSLETQIEWYFACAKQKAFPFLSYVERITRLYEQISNESAALKADIAFRLGQLKIPSLKFLGELALDYEGEILVRSALALFRESANYSNNKAITYCEAIYKRCNKFFYGEEAKSLVQFIADYYFKIPDITNATKWYYEYAKIAVGEGIEQLGACYHHAATNENNKQDIINYIAECNKEKPIIYFRATEAFFNSLSSCESLDLADFAYKLAQSSGKIDNALKNSILINQITWLEKAIMLGHKAAFNDYIQVCFKNTDGRVKSLMADFIIKTYLREGDIKSLIKFLEQISQANIYNMLYSLANCCSSQFDSDLKRQFIKGFIAILELLELNVNNVSSNDQDIGVPYILLASSLRNDRDDLIADELKKLKAAYEIYLFKKNMFLYLGHNSIIDIKSNFLKNISDKCKILISILAAITEPNLKQQFATTIAELHEKHSSPEIKLEWYNACLRESVLLSETQQLRFQQLQQKFTPMPLDNSTAAPADKQHEPLNREVEPTTIIEEPVVFMDAEETQQHLEEAKQDEEIFTQSQPTVEPTTQILATINNAIQDEVEKLNQDDTLTNEDKDRLADVSVDIETITNTITITQPQIEKINETIKHFMKSNTTQPVASLLLMFLSAAIVVGSVLAAVATFGAASPLIGLTLMLGTSVLAKTLSCITGAVGLTSLVLSGVLFKKFNENISPADQNPVESIRQITPQ